MRSSQLVSMLVSLALSIQAGCSGTTGREEVVREYPIASLDGVLTRSGVEFDAEHSSDGNGSLRIVATEPTTVRIFEVGDVDVEDGRLIYRAHIRTEAIRGQAYLEMWCRFPGKGEFFSRALHSPISGSTDWTTQETPFFLQAGQNPDNVKLNVVIDGTGTVWVDRIVLAKGVL